MNNCMCVCVLFGVVLLVSTSLANPVQSLERCSDDKEFYPHPDYCTRFYRCVHGIPVEWKCAKGTVFNEKRAECVIPGSEMDTCTPAHVDRECKRGTVDLIPHPYRCQGYYNCSDYLPYSIMNRYWSNGYEKECVYPQLFDIRLSKCVPYENAECTQRRKETKWKCEYYAAMCHGPCRPCWVSNPSCVGKADGLYPVPYNSTTYYFECEDERDWKGRLACPDKKIFDPKKKECVNRDLKMTVV